MQKKLIIALILYVVVISTSLGILSSISINEGIEQSLQRSLASAQMIANEFDFLLQSNFNRLYDISLSEKLQTRNSNWKPEKGMLEAVYQYSLFAEGVFLLDKHGNMLLSYPSRHFSEENMMFIPWVSRVLSEGKPIISNVYTLEPVKKPVIFAMVPLRSTDGEIIGVAGGAINPTNSVMSRFLRAVKAESNSAYIEIVDSNEIVVASDNPSHILEHHDHDGTLSKMIKDKETGMKTCGHGYSQSRYGSKTQDLLSIVPLQTVSWAIIVGQSKKEIFSPSQQLKRNFLILAVIFIGTALLFSVGIGKNIVSPIRSLITATNRIARGDLETPVGDVGSDETAVLGKSFDSMRERLAESLEHVRGYSVELEQRVFERTRELEEKRQQNEQLLKKLITSQEEERKRIARGLHDTILQDTSAFLIKLDICKVHPDQVSIEKIDDMRKIAVETIDNIHMVIKDLRPSIIDDLGLDSAIMWLLTNHLHEKGIHYYVEIEAPLKKRLPQTIEITLFRILQEAIINIARHSNAQNVFVVLEAKESLLDITIEDDGDGFDIEEMMRHPVEGGKGLGLMGMKERALLLDGILRIYSMPGEGTRVCIEIPLSNQEENV